MNRRDFLTFRVERRARVAELSCERLYMLLVDAELTGGSSENDDAESWCVGEPEAVYQRRSAVDLFEQIDRDLTDVDVLRITDREWLTSETLAHHLDRVVSEFCARGGRVEGHLKVAPTSPSTEGRHILQYVGAAFRRPIPSAPPSVPDRPGARTVRRSSPPAEPSGPDPRSPSRPRPRPRSCPARRAEQRDCGPRAPRRDAR